MLLGHASEVSASPKMALALLLVQAGEVEQRDRMCWQLVRQLAALDTSNEAAVKQLMAAVVQQQAGLVQEV